jgi:protease-4
VCLALAACEGRPQAKGSTPKDPSTGPKVAVFDLTGGISEHDEAPLLGPPTNRTLLTLLHRIDVVGKEKDTKAFFLSFGGLEIGLAGAEEVGEAFERLRKTGLPIVCHAHELTNASAYLAARACSKIFISPAGEVSTVGIAAQVVYLRKLLADELHLSIDILQVGKFKGAEEPLTRDGPSDEARESLESVLVDQRRTWLDGLRAARGDQVAKAVEDGPYSPNAAKAVGLIDEVGYADEAKEMARKLGGAVRDEVRFGPNSEEPSGGLDELLKALSGGEDEGPAVALLPAIGSISMGGGSLFGDGGITERDLGRQIRQVTNNDDIKAVVLRIDSPGGSALASDLLWHQLMALRKKKTLIVSVGGMAASGGYYLASTGQEIYADPGSIVGSMGVVGGKIGVGAALEHWGVHVETFPANKENPNAKFRAAYGSPLVPWDDDTKKRVLESMTSVYDLFLSRVAEGRGTTPDKIAPHAEGRIFSGTEGKKRGLVDKEAGIEVAIARAKELAKLPETARVVMMKPRSRLADLLGGDSDDGRGESTSPTPIGKALQQPSPTTEAFQKLVPELVPFAQSWVSLAQGERVLCVLPFALTLR